MSGRTRARNIMGRGMTIAASGPAPERHLLRLERYPAQDAVLTIDGQPCRVVRLKVTPDVTEILYEEDL